MDAGRIAALGRFADSSKHLSALGVGLRGLLIWVLARGQT
jgi:hypothetical protein